MTTNAIDITSLCISSMGIVLLISYLAFVQSVTHQKDFYQARRWKAAFWFASVPILILFAILLLPSITMIFNSSSGMHPIDLIEAMIVTILSTITWVIPLLFVLTIGIHYQFKWWLNSDDVLDKIWKDPNKGHKNPIQDL